MTAATAATKIENGPSRFVFGGVRFDLLAERRVSISLGARARELCVESARTVAGDVALSVTRAPELDGTGRDIDWRWQGEHARIRTAAGRAELRALGERHFAGSALVGNQRSALEAIVLATVGAVVERAGGLILHASAVQLDGRVVLFIGPSGAGKSTAANQAQSARPFAHDRAIVWPTRVGWYASALPGGKPGDRPITALGPVPVGAIARVVQGRRTEMRPLAPTAAVAAVRESCLTSSSASPVAALDLVESLCSAANVRELTTVLGEDLTDACRALVAG